MTLNMASIREKKKNDVSDSKSDNLFIYLFKKFKFTSEHFK